MVKQGLNLAVLLSSLLLAAQAEAKLYKWVDKEGVTHYGEVIPPEYSDRSSQTLSTKGRLQERIDSKGGKQELTEQQKAEQEAAAEQKRRDNALINTYTTEKEIDLALNRSLQLLEARVSSFTTMVRSAQETVDMHKKELAERTNGGKKPPQSLLDDLAASESRLDRLKKDLAHTEQEVVNVKARFEADRTRYRELKGTAPKK